MGLTYNALSAFGDKYIDAKVTNNVYETSAFIAWLNAKNKIKKLDGGNSITRSVINSKVSQGGEFAGAEALDSNQDDPYTAAEFQWRQIYSPMKISHLDINKNSGKAGKINLMMERADLMKLDMGEKLSNNIFGSGGTGTGSPKKFDGMGILLSTSVLYGNIPVADMVDWIANVDSNSGTLRPISLPLIQSLMGGCTFGASRIESLVCKQTLWDSIWGLFQPYQRVTSELMGKLGFDAIEINGKPVMVDNHVSSANHLIAVGSDYRLDVMANDYYKLVSFAQLESSDAIVKRITLTGNATTSMRKGMGLLSDVE